MTSRRAMTCLMLCCASVLAACGYDFSDHPSACSKSSDCKSGYDCYEKLCVKGGEVGVSGNAATAGSGAAGTHAGSSGAGNGGASGTGTAGTSSADAASADVDAAMMSQLDGGADAGDAGDAGSTPVLPTPPTCAAWTPPATSCPAACTGGCADGVCKFDCTGVKCVSVIVNCPKDFACFVDCTGGNACASATVNCPSNAPCELSCNGGNSCTGAAINCGGDACHLSCANGGAPVTGIGNAGSSCDAKKEPGCPGA